MDMRNSSQFGKKAKAGVSEKIFLWEEKLSWVEAGFYFYKQSTEKLFSSANTSMTSVTFLLCYYSIKWHIPGLRL